VEAVRKTVKKLAVFEGLQLPKAIKREKKGRKGILKKLPCSVAIA